MMLKRSEKISTIRTMLRQIGPSREIDWSIAEFLEPNVIPSEGLARGSRADAGIPFYTSLLDAAVNLTDRILPGWGWQVGRNGRGSAYAEVRDLMKNPSPETVFQAEHPSSAVVALLIAALHAYEARLRKVGD